MKKQISLDWKKLSLQIKKEYKALSERELLKPIILKKKYIINDGYRSLS